MQSIIFRVDSSKLLGSGHLMRCITLAKLLKDKAKITFVCRELEGNLSHFVEKEGFRLYKLPQTQHHEELHGYENLLTVPQKVDACETKMLLTEKIDCLVVDNYALDMKWENFFRDSAKKILVIDDLANRKHNCDILLDQNYVFNFDHRYDALVPPACKKFLGPQHVVLRDEFFHNAKSISKNTSAVKNILVFFGNSDITNETMKSLSAIKLLDQYSLQVDVVIGESNPYRKELMKYADKASHVSVYCQIDFMAELMKKADLALGAGGTTIWERCFLGLPSLVISTAENQVESCKACAKLGCIEYLGKSADVDKYTLSGKIQHYLASPESVNNMRLIGMQLMRPVKTNRSKLVSAILE